MSKDVNIQRRHLGGPPSFRGHLAAALLVAACGTAVIHAQTMEDGVMLSRGTLCTGVMYTHDTWDHYWEGSLERTNGNVGTIRHQTATAAANYGIRNWLNVIGDVPYVWTDASQGVLHGQQGWQDLSLAVKADALRLPVADKGYVRVIVVASGSLPITNYTPDIYPLSIGAHSKTVSGRGTLNFNGRKGLYVNASLAHTFRGNVTLDRPAYYTDNQFFLSNQVNLPSLFEYSTDAGYYRRDLKIIGTFMQQQSRGGGDIRRQDLPFVSNRMNFSRAGVELQYPLPRRLHNIQYWAAYNNTFQGRNVGQSATLTTGVMYTFHRERRTAP